MTTRTNLIPNPSLEVDATGWQSNSAFGDYDVATVARSTTQAWVGTASLQVTCPTPGAAARTWGNVTATPVTPGLVYTFSAYVRSATAATFFADALYMEQGADVAVPANTWTRVAVTFVANTEHVFCGVGTAGASAGFVYYIDGALLERGGDLGGYFDGTTTDTVDITYEWTGTAHASTSTEVSPDPIPSSRLSAMDVLRLEVEADPEPGQLVNLVENPNGEYGGYGWNTTIAGSTLFGFRDTLVDPPRWVLTYLGSIEAGASYFRTESMPMVAGQYVAARWHYIESGADAYRARLTFLDANGSIISSTAYFTYNSPTNEVPANTGPFLAPANTVSVRLAFECGDAGGVYPITVRQAYLRLTGVTVAVAATAAELGETRTNIITNPSAETNTTGWSGVSGALTRVTSPAPAQAGTFCFHLLKNAGTAMALAESASGAAAHVVTSGQTWRVAARARRSGLYPDEVVRFEAFWYTAAGTPLATPQTVFATTATPAATTWFDVEGTVQVPTGASRMMLRVYCGTPGGSIPNGTSVDIDAIICERYNPAHSDYFDGSTAAAGGWTYAWTGTNHNSTSVATNSNLGFVEPVTYNDVLGDLREASWVREELNVGTLSAVVVNPDLSPVVAETLRPGRRFRMMMNPDPSDGGMETMSFGGWTESLIVGRLSNAKVEYRPLERDPARKAIISLTATDPIALLANAKRPNTVATVPELPYVVEGAGVPWVTDGASDQVASATVVVTNDGASALDQIAITRDTAGGYAWVDRRGVLQVVSGFPDPTAEMLINGSFTSTLGSEWTGVYCAVTRVTPPAPLSSDGGTCAQMVSSAFSTRIVLAQGWPVTAPHITVIAGQILQATAYVRSSVARPSRLAVNFYDDEWNLILSHGNSVEDDIITPTATWEARETTVTVPNGATLAVALYNVGFGDEVTVVPSGENHWIDGISLKAIRPTPYELDESVYNHNFVVDYDTDRAINSVAIHRQWTHPSEGPQETVYGPYTDASSVSEWGTRHATVTVAGTAVADIPALGAAILEKNATPEVRVQSLQIPINRDTLQYATLDLYDLVHVTNESVGIDSLMRIVGITHSVVANPNLAEDDRWLMTLDFAAENGIATPTQAPALPSSTADSELYVDLVKNGSSQSIANDTSSLVIGWTVNSNTGGGTLFGSSKVITTPGLHAVSGTATFVAGSSGRRLLILQVNGADIARDEVTSSGLVTLNAANTVFVNAGETVQMLVYQVSGGSLNLDGLATRNHFTVARIGG